MTEKRQTSQGYIIRILQHFATKLWNITNFVMLFQAVMKFLSRLVEIKILSITQVVNLIWLNEDESCDKSCNRGGRTYFTNSSSATGGSHNETILICSNWVVMLRKSFLTSDQSNGSAEVDFFDLPLFLP
jgi:hypothetical protein